MADAEIVALTLLPSTAFQGPPKQLFDEAVQLPWERGQGRMFDTHAMTPKSVLGQTRTRCRRRMKSARRHKQKLGEGNSQETSGFEYRRLFPAWASRCEFDLLEGEP